MIIDLLFIMDKRDSRFNRNYAIEFLLHNLTNENQQLTPNTSATHWVIFIVKVKP